MKNLILLPWALVQVLLLFECPESTNGQGLGFLFEASAKIQKILATGQNKDIPSVIKVLSDISAEAAMFLPLQCPSEAGGNFEVCLAPVQNTIQEMNSDNDSDKTNQQVVETKIENCGLLRGTYYCAKSVLDTCPGKRFVPFDAVQSIIKPKLGQLECDETVFDNRPYVPSPTLRTTPVPTTTTVPPTVTETSRTDPYFSSFMAARTTPAPLVLTTSQISNGLSNHGQDMSFPFKLILCLVTLFHTISYLCNCL